MSIVRLWLQLRYHLGWGRPAAYRAMIAIRCFQLAVVTSFISLFLIGGLLDGVLRHQGALSVSWLGIIGIVVLSNLALWAEAVSTAWSAHQAQQGRCTQIQGQCLAIIDPAAQQEQQGRQERPSSALQQVEAIVFAHIRPLQGKSHWYVLPSTWEHLLTPSPGPLILEVLAGTGWVVRLNQLDRRQQLYWDIAGLSGTREQLSSEEVEELERLARRAWSAEGIRPRSALIRALIFLLGVGPLFSGFGAVWATSTVLHFTAFMITLPVFFLGLCVIVLSLWRAWGYAFFLLHAWWKARARSAELWTLEGMLIGCWSVRHPYLATRLIQVRTGENRKQLLVAQEPAVQSLPALGAFMRIDYLAEGATMVKIEILSRDAGHPPVEG